MKTKRVIVWFRQDLRLHDNEALTEAILHSEEILPVYVFDPRVFTASTPNGFPKTGKYRAQFIIESVHDLRASLKKLGSNLIVRVGKPENVLYDLANEVKSSWIFCNRERTKEELLVQDRLEEKLWSIGQEIRYNRGKLLYHTQDLPFPVTHTPDTFTQFRKEVEKMVAVRQPFPTPSEQFEKITIDIPAGDIPTIASLGHDPIIVDDRAAHVFIGGESTGLSRLNYYLFESKRIKTYKETRNEMIGSNYSSKFSAWLAQGCLSPKTVYHSIKAFEAEHGSNKSTYWLYFELLWRDFFRLMAKKHKNNIFKKGGTKQEPNDALLNDKRLLDVWVRGKTGVPLIDANMREISLTGFMSNRGRQLVASFLVNDLHLNWKMGAEYFESILIDYDVASNWGNWNYIAGVGSDPRENRYFNILAQASKYDSKGEYVKLWLPELEAIPSNKIHRPDSLSSEEQSELSFTLGADYPKAMINMEKWA
mgnify:CR=1 FL=1